MSQSPDKAASLDVAQGPGPLTPPSVSPPEAPTLPSPRVGGGEGGGLGGDRGGAGRGLLAWLGRTVPPLIVFTALGGLLAWGHYTGWTIPKFSTLTGNRQTEKDDWCSEHGVPESECVECNPDLLPKTKEFGWCKDHRIPECPFEHPEVAQLKEKPRISSADLERARRALNFAERAEPNSKCKLHLRRIQFASQEAVQKAGFEVEEVGIEPIEEVVSANGEVTYDQTRVARLSSRLPGTAWRVYKQIGERVERGEVLALVDAADLGKAKAEFLVALAQLELKRETAERLREAGVRGAASDRSVREAETARREAEVRVLSAEQALINLGLPLRAEDLKGLSPQEMTRRIQFLGLPEAVTRTLDPKTTTANLLPLQSPLDGMVIAREVVPGEVLDTAKVLFVVADIRQMWVTLNVRLEDAKKLHIDQSVRFRPDGSKPSEDASGKLAWISTAADEKTRTVKVRAELQNSQGQLRSNTFGTGRVVLRQEKDAIVVPNEAVHWDGDCPVVFVRDKDFFKLGSPKVFHVRKVRPGAKNDKFTEIIAGVLPGENVASKGSGVLRSELLKNNLGEG